LLVAAFVAELIRCLLFAIDLGSWFLVAMPALGGLTAVVIGILMPLVVADLTEQSGRNNFTLGAVIMVGGVGAAVIALASGFVTPWLGFAAGFLMLTLVAAGATARIWLRFQETVESARRRPAPAT
jgi:hypothetical protein